MVRDFLFYLSHLQEFPELIFVDELIAATAYAQALQSIDATGIPFPCHMCLLCEENLANDFVWLFSGSLDSIVVPGEFINAFSQLKGVVEKLNQYYSYYVNNSRIKSTFDIPAEHAFVTDNFGSECKGVGIHVTFRFLFGVSLHK